MYCLPHDGVRMVASSAIKPRLRGEPGQGLRLGLALGVRGKVHSVERFPTLTLDRLCVKYMLPDAFSGWNWVEHAFRYINRGLIKNRLQPLRWDAQGPQRLKSVCGELSFRFRRWAGPTNQNPEGVGLQLAQDGAQRSPG